MPYGLEVGFEDDTLESGESSFFKGIGENVFFIVFHYFSFVRKG